MKPIADYEYVELGAEISTSVPRPDVQALIDFNSLDIGIDAPQVTDDEADRILGAIWQVMITLTDLGFGRHPIEQIDKRTDLRADLHRMADCIYREVMESPRPDWASQTRRG